MQDLEGIICKLIPGVRESQNEILCHPEIHYPPGYKDNFFCILGISFSI
jgi:hypothetical protein